MFSIESLFSRCFIGSVGPFSYISTNMPPWGGSTCEKTRGTIEAQPLPVVLLRMAPSINRLLVFFQRMFAYVWHSRCGAVFAANHVCDKLDFLHSPVRCFILLDMLYLPDWNDHSCLLKEQCKIVTSNKASIILIIDFEPTHHYPTLTVLSQQ